MDSDLISSKNSSQIINFKGSETESCAEVLARDVTINCSEGTHNKGSSKVKLKNVIDYNWEFKYYFGQLVACHIDGKIYAYTIKPKGKFAMLRVVNLQTEERALVKDFKGSIQDISFALTPKVILGCVDEEWNLSVYSIESLGTMTCTLLMNVRHTMGSPLNNNYQVIWCPYVPTCGEEADTLDDPAKLLVLLNGSIAEIWDVSIINSKFGTAPLEPIENTEGYIEIDCHSRIIDASFSPDGTALATASDDGFVRFFQVGNDARKLLHQWQPHDGKPLSCLLFLDNIKTYAISDCKFWKFAVTGAENNVEIKIWSCESWSCLQSIRFKLNPKAIVPDMFLKVVLDHTAEYLLISDINNRILYVLKIQKNEEERAASVSTISEFLQPASILSFAIMGVTSANLRYSSNEDLYEEVEDTEEDSTSLSGTTIKMLVVQPKSLQDCIITLKPEGFMDSDLKSVYGNVVESEESNGEKVPKDLPKLNDLQSSVTLLIQQNQQSGQSLNLMTPDDFNSCIVNSSPSNARNSLDPLAITSPSSVTKEIIADFKQPIKDNCASAGSSPSREVQEILLNQSAQDFFENFTKIGKTEPTANYSNDDKPETKSAQVVWPDIPMIEEQDNALRHKEIDESDNKLYALNFRLLSLENLIKEQKEEIQQLRQEVKQKNNAKKTSEFEMSNVFAKELDTALSKHLVQSSKLMESHFKDQKRREKELTDHLVATLSKQIKTQVAENLQFCVSDEIRVNVIPTVLNVFEKLQARLEFLYNQKLSALDAMLKNNIAKTFQSKSMSDSLSNSINTVIKPSLESCYKDLIATALVPSWEKICNAMFQQIHNTFTQGTKEYTSSVENYMERQRKVQDKGKELINQMQAVSETMKSNAEKISTLVSEDMQRNINLALNSMQEKLSQVVTEVVKQQIKSGFKTHSAHLEDSVVNAVKSRAVTPSPHVIDTQMQLQQLHNLITKGNIDVAFQQALSASATASDLSLVLYVCENVATQEVFGNSKCILQQHVLLSLVQQLGADLMHKTDVKQRYLQEAVLNLEVNNPVTKEHVPAVLSELSKQLRIFIMSNPSHRLISNMRMLLMATKALMS